MGHGANKTSTVFAWTFETPVGAEKTVKALARKYVLGMVTSRVKESVYSIPALAELQEYFRVMISYQDTERHKPDPEPLLLAAMRLNAKPEESVYIGDVESDMHAAKAAGMKGILYAKQTVPQADACTFSFGQIPELIAFL